MTVRPAALLVVVAAMGTSGTVNAAPTEEAWAVGGQIGFQAPPEVNLPVIPYGVHVRRVLVSHASVGISYEHLHYDLHYDQCLRSDCPDTVDALRAFGELHLRPAAWFDPWVRVGVGPDVRRGSNWYDATKPAGTRVRFGFDALLGLDLHVPHFAIGPHVRHGLLGLGFGVHAEARF